MDIEGIDSMKLGTLHAVLTRRSFADILPEYGLAVRSARALMVALSLAASACTQQPPPCGPPLPDVPVPERARYCCISSEGDRENFVCLTLTSTIHPCSIDWCCECEDR